MKHGDRLYILDCIRNIAETINKYEYSKNSTEFNITLTLSDLLDEVRELHTDEEKLDLSHLIRKAGREISQT